MYKDKWVDHRSHRVSRPNCSSLTNQRFLKLLGTNVCHNDAICHAQNTKVKVTFKGHMYLYVLAYLIWKARQSTHEQSSIHFVPLDQSTIG